MVFVFQESINNPRNLNNLCSFQYFISYSLSSSVNQFFAYLNSFCCLIVFFCCLLAVSPLPIFTITNIFFMVHLNCLKQIIVDFFMNVVDTDLKFIGRSAVQICTSYLSIRWNNSESGWFRGILEDDSFSTWIYQRIFNEVLHKFLIRYCNIHKNKQSRNPFSRTPVL